jgi:Fe-S-cluster containining protein/predicted house-cleaning noncanonical NTP pyrophosphatase (MazG superfamily)
MITTKLSLQDKLPLTCSRKGTCCHGNLVYINPWELVSLAKEKNITPREFKELYCDFGGIRLRFNGKEDARNKPSCSQYIENFGCSVHLGRPLACRLFPIGRQIQNEKANYLFQGTEFPCLNGCSEVTELPYLSVDEYLKGQETDNFEKAQDVYLDLMQNLADIAFTLLLDTSLASSGDKETLRQWRKMGAELPENLAERINPEWLDCLLLPEINDDLEDPILFAQKHNDLLQTKAQNDFEILQTNQEFQEASVLIMAVTLHIARAIGANPKNLSELWIETAKEHGALE